MPILGATARTVEGFLTFVGEIFLLAWDSLRRLFRRPFEFEETIHQCAFVGVLSVPIVALTGFFSGAVMSLYLSRFLSAYGAGGFVGGTVGLTIARELGPVVTGIVVAARAGSAMAAQIGTMEVTEQVDALRMLRVHPTGYLVIPRILACVVMLPILALVCMWAGMLGGYLVSLTEGVPGPVFLNSVQRFLETGDFLKGMAKMPVFGLIIALVACQQGLRTSGGAVGVGRATTNSVVYSIVLVYIANFLLARGLF